MSVVDVVMLLQDFNSRIDGVAFAPLTADVPLSLDNAQFPLSLIEPSTDRFSGMNGSNQSTSVYNCLFFVSPIEQGDYGSNMDELSRLRDAVRNQYLGEANYKEGTQRVLQHTPTRVTVASSVFNMTAIQAIERPIGSGFFYLGFILSVETNEDWEVECVYEPTNEDS